MSFPAVETHPIAIAPDFLAAVPGLYIEAVVVRGLQERAATAPSPEVDRRIEQLLARYGRPEAAEELAREPMIVSYAHLHRSLAEGETKTVPSVENLVGRYIAKGKFPRINRWVDAANVVSAQDLRPVGVFDAGRIAGGITLERARPGDTFVPLGKNKPEKIAPGSAILRDQEKVFSMIGVRDSADTMVRDETDTLLVLSWGYGSVPRDEVRGTVRRVADLLLG